MDRLCWQQRCDRLAAVAVSSCLGVGCGWFAEHWFIGFFTAWAAGSALAVAALAVGGFWLPEV